MSTLKCDLPWPWLASWQSWSWPHRKPLCTWHSHPSLLSSRGAPPESEEIKRQNKTKKKPVNSKPFLYIVYWHRCILIAKPGGHAYTHSQGQLRESPPGSVIHPWKTHTICSGYWKTSLWGSKQKGHFTTALMTTKKKLSETHSTILCHHWMFIKPFFPPSRTDLRTGEYTEKTDFLCVDEGRWCLWFVECRDGSTEGVSLRPEERPNLTVVYLDIFLE